MSENIELQSLRTFNTDSIDTDAIEEYYDAEPDSTPEFTLTSQLPDKVASEYDFFTDFDVETTQKHSKKKKKNKKRDNSNIMDIIRTELATVEVPIKENIITNVDFSMEPSYVEKKLRMVQKFRSNFAGDRSNFSSCNLSPIFPRVLQNTTIETEDIAVEYTKPTNFDSLVANMEELVQVKPKFLDIEIRNLKFKHHHNFSLEKLLVEKLILVNREFETIDNSLKCFSRDIKVNRRTKDNLKQELPKISTMKDDIRFDATIRNYIGQMIELKNRQFEMLKKEKEVLNEIVSLWSDIQMVREKSGKTRTSAVLEITQNDIDEEEYQKEWSQVFEQELNDLLEETEFEYATKYIEYKENKYTKAVEYNQKNNMAKPKLYIDEESLKEKAEKRTNNLVRINKIDIKLKTNNYKDSVHYSKARKTFYHFKIYVDDLFVCESEHYYTKKDFNVEFLESFSVQILPENAALNLVLHENGEATSEMKLKLSKIKKNTAISEFIKLEFVYNNIIAPSVKSVGSGHNIKEIAAANKVRLKSSNVFDGQFYTKCEIDIKTSWNEKLNEDNHENLKTMIELDKKIKRLISGINKPTIDDMKEFIEHIYEQDISENEKIMNTLINICQSNIYTDDDFVFDENSSEFVRIKLLNLRNDGELSNVKNKVIPLFASQITTEQLNCLQKSKEKDFDINSFNAEKYVDTDPVELQRFIGTKYVDKLNENLQRNLNETILRKTYKDVVCDFRDLSLRGLFSSRTSLTNFATIANGARQTLSELLQKEQEIHISVLRAFNLPDRTPSVITEDNIEDRGDSIAGFKVRSLRPFVKVSCQGCVAQTAAAIGCHPTWNQPLKIVTKPGHLSSIYINLYDEQKVNVTENFADDASYHSRTFHFRCFSKWLGSLEVPLYTVVALGKIKGTFKIKMPSLLLGYETHRGEKESGRSLIPEVTQLLRKETSYITLQITTKTGLGFNHRYDLPTVNNTEDDYIIKHLNKFISEYQIDFPSRHISLTLIDTTGKNKCLTQFLQPLPLPDYAYFPKNPKKSESAVSKSSNQSKSSSSKSMDLKRNVDLEKGQDIEKESLYSSYEGRNLRKDDVSMERLINAALRYVSLIPCYEVKDSHVITLMGVELIRILYGSPLDHTLLLASYLLQLGLKVYIAIGLGLPRGQSSYVLAKYDLRNRRLVSLNDPAYGKSGFLSKSNGFVWYVYDAMSGERFELRDVSCPLKTVDYVFDNENIWVNIQSAQDCESVSFDFSKSSDWQSVFDKNIFIMKHPMISDTNLYSLPVDVDELRNALESRIKFKFQKWRSHMKTIWNRYCSTLLRDSLAHWEYWALSPTEQRPVLGQRMRQLLATYKVYGFPINLPYTSTKAVVSTVKATSLHMNDDPNTEFGLGVEVYSYPNSVVSVWVFLASVTRI